MSKGKWVLYDNGEKWFWITPQYIKREAEIFAEIDQIIVDSLPPITTDGEGDRMSRISDEIIERGHGYGMCDQIERNSAILIALMELLVDDRRLSKEDIDRIIKRADEL